MRLDLSGPMVPPRDPLDKRLDVAEGHLDLRMPLHALKVLEGRPLWATRHFRACFLMGRALRQLGRFREALRSLEIAGAILPDDRRVALNLAWCYKRTHQLAQAIDALERAKLHSPNSARLRYNLACYWGLAGVPLKALEELRAAIERGPHYARLAERDEDLKGLRLLPEFRAIVSGQVPARP